MSNENLNEYVIKCSTKEGKSKEVKVKSESIPDALNDFATKRNNGKHKDVKHVLGIEKVELVGTDEEE